MALVQVAIAAMLCGRLSLPALAQWVRERVAAEAALLTARGRPRGRTACVATFRRLVKALDVAAFEPAVGQWLAPTGVGPAAALAMDGKALRGVERPGGPGG